MVLRAMFTFTGRVSVRRNTSDGAASDKGIAIAIAEELDTPDEVLQPTEN